MADVRLFYSERSKFEHESEQIKEIYDIISNSDIEKPVYMFTNFRLANGEIDCLILTKKGPVILDLKAISGTIVGDENSTWKVIDENGEEKELNTNLFRQLQRNRYDLIEKLSPIYELNFSFIDYEDIAKIGSWGYFKKGSEFDYNQIGSGALAWFKIVTADTLLEKLRFVDAGYTLNSEDMNKIAEALHLTEYTVPNDDKISNDEQIPVQSPDIPDYRITLEDEDDKWCIVRPELTIFKGNCPKAVSKDAKYSIRFYENEYVVGIVYEHNNGELWYPVNEKHKKLVDMVNKVKIATTGSPGGTFYINEYNQVIVPIATNKTYYLAGEYYVPLQFIFEDNFISGDAIDLKGNPLSSGDEWVGPHAGIPYILEAGGKDIRYEFEPRPRVKTKVKLSKYRPPESVHKICQMLMVHKGFSGGRFYINEFQHIFTPINAEEIKYVYVGKIENLDDWFPKIDD